MKALALLLRLVLGGLFVVAGVLKLGDPTRFAIEIGNYRLWPQVAPYLAVTLPFVEVVLGLAVVLAPRPWRLGAALGLVGLLTTFTVAVSQAVGRGINVDCGCFGGQSGPVTGLTVVRDLALLAVGGAVLWLESRRGPATTA
jgi:uncharacterized membrane protein YphA (DoxX/SURF4 family)